MSIRMRAMAWLALLTAHRPYLRPACRVVAGVRRSRPRNFHRSAVAYRIPEESDSTAASETKDDSEDSGGPEEVNGQALAEGEIVDDVENASESNGVLQRLRRRGDYGSGIRRTNRSRRAPEPPHLTLPEWFWDKNVWCSGDLDQLTDRLSFYGQADPSGQTTPIHDTASAAQTAEKGSSASFITIPTLTNIISADIIPKIEKGLLGTGRIIEEVRLSLQTLKEQRGSSQRPPYPNADTDNTPDPHVESETQDPPVAKARGGLSATNNYQHSAAEKYSLHRDVYREIFTSIRAGLRVQAPTVNIKDVLKFDIVLQSPDHRASNFLNVVVQQTASDLEADVVRLDSEDIARILGEYLGENIAWTKCSTALLGYESHRRTGRLESTENKEPTDDEEPEDLDENEDILSAFKSHIAGANHTRSPLAAAVTILQGPPKVLVGQDVSKVGSLFNFLGQPTNSSIFATRSATPGESWNDYKVGRFCEALVDAASAKRARIADSITAAAQNPTSNAFPVSKGLIIQISDYKKLSENSVGSNILQKLREVVKRRWYEGSNIIIVGTTAETVAAERAPSEVYNSIDQFTSDAQSGRPRTILIPPHRHPTQNWISLRDQETLVRDLNLRHVEDMVRKLSSADNKTDLTVDLTRNLSLSIDHDFELKGSVWDYARVQRIAMAMLGSGSSSTVLDGSALEHTLTILNASDDVKYAWAKEEKRAYVAINDATDEAYDVDTGSSSNKATKDKLNRLRKSCTPHEKKLLGGVIDPADLQTTFADVRAPPETIEALKTLTSLSLIRPDSFSYGVLATDKIPGLLLYGPPGTGKTLLAKAVAKESGATMLEVSASEINDMYVGEGEKNVKAVFSLAKKLSPCVVFIDEADALFGARGDSTKRTSHRELINQFLREWDGMNDLSAFIMVATNRPFDLDEAVLRRLPRRLLVDLPVEKDREAILKIHLRDEILDDSISLTKLARDTPFYSGSDLKNLSVAAALACVREENDSAAKHTGNTPYTYPPKRILRKEHFDKAMEEISASISEDMSTLSAIRKFDERYGDRKGRRKRGAALGFGGTMEPDKDSEAGRVRKIQVEV